MITQLDYYELISLTILFIYLIISSIRDFKSHTISLKYSIITLIFFLFLNLISKKFNVLALLINLSPAIFLIMLSYFSKQAIGYGDGFVTAILGIELGFNITICIVFFSFILTSIFSLFLLVRRKSMKTTLPFIPFITCSCFITILLF